ncbi:uncharacterized protein YALI1_D03639g [Yarrowia lipolytica]|uniref:Uncharacterized protein n=1 Tax=Yarrowia lipolytica TaxID=4952 RepID=A0A1D8ND01_YARLL|nr:hypothetical protein YALI1_D03639g [Yarrowia lipolytica]
MALQIDPTRRTSKLLFDTDFVWVMYRVMVEPKRSMYCTALVQRSIINTITYYTMSCVGRTDNPSPDE